MKKLFGHVIFLSAFITSQAQRPESADRIISDAHTVALKENKNIFVIFHASWCGWCHKMDSAMNDPVIKQYFSDNYLVRHIVVMESDAKKEFENPGGREMMYKYHGENAGIPFWFVLDKNNRLLADSREISGDGKTGSNVGCPATDNEVSHFINVLKATSRIDENGLLAIKARFRKINQGS